MIQKKGMWCTATSIFNRSINSMLQGALEELRSVRDYLIDNYYTKQEVDAKDATHYTKDEADDTFVKKEELNNYPTNDEVKDLFKNYYTKSEIDKLLKNYNPNPNPGGETMTEQDVQTLINNSLSNYATNTALDSLSNRTKTIETSLNSFGLCITDYDGNEDIYEFNNDPEAFALIPIASCDFVERRYNDAVKNSVSLDDEYIKILGYPALGSATFKTLKGYNTVAKDNPDNMSEQRLITDGYFNLRLTSYVKKAELDLSDYLTVVGARNAYLSKSDANSNFYNKSEIDTKLANISTGGSVDLDGYLKKTDAANTYATKTSLDNYTSKTSLTDTLKSYVTNTAMSSYLSGYVTTTALSNILDSKGYVTNSALTNYLTKTAAQNTYATFSNLTDFGTNFYTKTEIDNKLKNLNTGSTSVDLSNYYTKTDCDNNFITSDTAFCYVDGDGGISEDALLNSIDEYTLASKDYVDNQIIEATIDETTLNTKINDIVTSKNLVTTTNLNNTLSTYATQSYVTTKINEIETVDTSSNFQSTYIYRAENGMWNLADKYNVKTTSSTDDGSILVSQGADGNNTVVYECPIYPGVTVVFDETTFPTNGNSMKVKFVQKREGGSLVAISKNSIEFKVIIIGGTYTSRISYDFNIQNFSASNAKSTGVYAPIDYKFEDVPYTDITEFSDDNHTRELTYTTANNIVKYAAYANG